MGENISTFGAAARHTSSIPATGPPLWAIGHHAALGFSPFGIDDVPTDNGLGSAYKVIEAIAPTLLKYQSEGKVMAILQGDDASVKEFEDSTGLSLKFGDIRSMMGPPPPAPKQDEKKDAAAEPSPAFGPPPKDTRGFAIVIHTAPNQFLIAGEGVIVTSSKQRLGTVDELLVEKGRTVGGRRMNGDETQQGNFFSLATDLIEVRKVLTY